MSGTRLTIEELYAIQTAGGRNNGEESRALPARAYGDPSNVVEFPAEIERQRKLKNAKKSKQKFKYRGNR